MSSQISTLQTALDAAAKDAKDAIAKATEAEQAAKAAGDAAKEAQEAAKRAAAEAEAKAIEAARAEVEKAKADLEKMVAEGLADNKQALDAMRVQVEEVTKKVEATIGVVTDMVTSVSLVSSVGAEVDDLQGILRYQTAIEKENVFGKGFETELAFHKGNQVQTPADEFIIRVSPTNAVLRPEMISLVNSKGENLDDLIEVVSVQKYDKLISVNVHDEVPVSRAASNSGLWVVKTALKNYDKEKFQAAQLTEGDRYITYAVQVNNTLSTAANRYVTSTYEFILKWNEFKGDSELNYFVNDKNVNTISNRFYTRIGLPGLTTISSPTAITKINYQDLAWTGEAAVEGIFDNTDASKNNAKLDKADNRNIGKKMLPVEQGKPFKISLTKDENKIIAPTNVRAMYVTLDVEENAVESAPSEWEAWTKAYSYKGLNTVVEGTEAEVIINSENAINDVIGFRVYAVNYDGTLVDPDGKAFYVAVGKNVQDTHFDLTWTWSKNNFTDISEAEIPEGFFDEAFVNEVSGLTFSADTVAYGNKEGKEFVKNEAALLFLDKDKNITIELSKAKYLTFSLNRLADSEKPYYYDDDKVYSAKFQFKNARGNVLRNLVVNFKKVVPTTIPEGYNRKSSQIVNDVYTCYLNGTYDSTAAGAWSKLDVDGFGQMQLFNVFNGLDDSNYVFSFAAAKEEGKNLVNADVVVDKKYQLLVANKFIDSKTKHATTVEYNYGKISSEAVDATGAIADYKVPADKFETIFACPFSVSTWSWIEKFDADDKKEEAVKAEVAYGKEAKFDIARVFSTNAYTKTLTAGLDVLLGNGVKQIKSCALASVENSEKEYFKVAYVATDGTFVFTPVETSVESNPTTDVPSKLNIVFVDVFNHENTITLDFTVKKH